MHHTEYPQRLLAKLGFTVDQVEHVANTQVPQLVTDAIIRIQASPFDIADGAYVGHSGGKDSVLVRWLADEAVPEYDLLTVHTPKPDGIRNAVHPITQKFMYDLGRPVLYLPDGSGDIFDKYGLKTQIDGTRAAEASRRDGRDVGVIMDGKECSRADMPLYLGKGLFDRQFVYPIYDWSDIQVWAAILHHDIPFTAEYYEEDHGL